MTAFILSSGQERSFALRAGDSLAVLSGGTSSDSTVGGRAIETVMAGGRSFVDQIQSGGEIDLQSGALLQGGTVSSGGVLSLAQGANADPAVISAGGLVEGAGVLGYPDGYVSDYGVISGVAVEDDNNGLAITVSDGGSIEAATLYDGLVVLSSASASGTKVDGGSLVIDAGGSASSTVVSAYGQQDVYAGGRDIGTVVSHGGAEVVLSGGVASDVTVLRGGVLALERGARILKSVVSSGGELAFGFVSSGQVVSAGIVLTKSEVVSGVTLAAGATTGLDGDTTVQSGGLVKIGSSGLADDYVIVSEGGRIDGAGPLTKATFVWDYGVVSGVALGAAGEGGASLSVGSNGIANAITIMSGGMSLMDDDTRASGTVVEGSHASLTIWAGRATDTRVSSGGFVSSYEGAFLSNLDVIAGGIVSGR